MGSWHNPDWGITERKGEGRRFDLIADAARQLAEALETCGLTVAQAQLLDTLERRHEQGFDPPLSDLSLLHERSNAGVSRTVKELWQRGLVERRYHPRDLRIKNVILTEKGKIALAKARERCDEVLYELRWMLSRLSSLR
jgi:DNA-binding MarR family transcriptional regulator